MNVYKLTSRVFYIFLAAFFFISCTSMPSIRPLPQTMETCRNCSKPFFDIPHRLVHAIEVSLPGGGTDTVLGITAFDPADRSLRSTVITIEGLVLFDAHYDKKLYVHRALPPFNAEHFAGYMMEDIRLIFFPPEGNPAEAGTLTDGSMICRYRGDGNMIEDVIVHTDNTWEITTYRNRFEKLRHLKAFSIQDGVPAMLELTAFSQETYKLNLRLISSEAVSSEEIRSIYENTSVVE